MLLSLLSRAARCVVPVCLLFCGAAATAYQQTADPSRFELTELVRGLVQPMELSVGPDGTVWLIEIAGKLQRLSPGSSQLQLAGEL